MSNLLLCYPNLIDVSRLYTPTFSGGSWSGSLPLTNLADRALENVARSTNAALTSTIVKADLGVARSVRAFIIPKHTISAAGDVRWRLFAASPIFNDTAFNSWTSIGTPTIATGQADPLGGTRAVLVGDDDAAAAEGKETAVTFTGDGVKTFCLTLKAGTATQTEFGIWDNTAATYRHLVRASWSGGVPTLSTVSGSGTLYTAFNPATGYYELMATGAGVVAANTNRFRVFGAGTTVANTGNTSMYEAMAFDFATQPILIDSGVNDAYLSTLTAEDVDGLNVASVYVAAAAQSGRYVWCEIADTANSAGYIDLARMFIATGYQPTINASYGLQLGLESESVRNVVDGGAAKYQAKPNARTVRFALENIAEAEAFASPWKIQRLAGKTKQLFFVWDPSDTTLMHERAFLGVLRQLNALEFPAALYNAAGFEIVEDL